MLDLHKTFFSESVAEERKIPAYENGEACCRFEDRVVFENMPEISIIIVTYNRASICCQTVLHFVKLLTAESELIVIDQGPGMEVLLLDEIAGQRKIRRRCLPFRFRGQARSRPARVSVGLEIAHMTDWFGRIYFAQTG